MTPPGDFQRNADASPSLLRELLGFLVHSRKWWLLPVIIVLLLLALLATLSTTGAAPFLYTLY